MNTLTSTLLALAVLLVAQTSSAQYYPDEECHYECEVAFCDSYGCSYDCYEVCYPYSPQNPIRDILPTKGQQITDNVQLPRAKIRGKTPQRMRIQNPSYQKVVRGGQAVLPRAFARFDNCKN